MQWVGTAMTVTGTYVLPSPILVREGLLGKVSSFEFEGDPVEVLLPSLDSEGAGIPPDLPELKDSSGDRTDWISSPPDPRAGWIGPPPTPTSGPGVFQLRRVGIRLPSWSDSFGAGEYLNRWFDLMATWIEVRFAQDLNWNWPVSHLEIPGSNFEPSSPRDASSRVLVYWDSSTPLDDRDWEGLLRLSSSGKLPPLEEILLCSAKSWERRRKNRLAMIDVGLAAEISVGKLLRKKFDPLFDVKNNKFYDMINLIYKKNIPVNITKDSLHSLRKDRNSAIHDGIEISSQNLVYSILTVNQLVRDIQD